MLILVELSHKLHKANITKVVNVIHNLGKKKKEQDKVAHEACPWKEKERIVIYSQVKLVRCIFVRT